MSQYYRHPKSLGKRKSRCILCTKEYNETRKVEQKQYRQENKEKQKEYFVGYYESNKSVIRKRSSEFYENNKNDPKFKEKRLESKRSWRRRKPEMITRENHLKAARQRGLISEWSYDEIQSTLDYFGNRCALTGDEVTLHFDHVIPLGIGHAGTVKWNMLPIKAGLNISKSNKNLFEWFDANEERLRLDRTRLKTALEYLAGLKGVSYEDYVAFINQCYENN